MCVKLHGMLATGPRHSETRALNGTGARIRDVFATFLYRGRKWGCVVHLYIPVREWWTPIQDRTLNDIDHTIADDTIAFWHFAERKIAGFWWRVTWKIAFLGLHLARDINRKWQHGKGIVLYFVCGLKMWLPTPDKWCKRNNEHMTRHDLTQYHYWHSVMTQRIMTQWRDLRNSIWYRQR